MLVGTVKGTCIGMPYCAPGGVPVKLACPAFLRRELASDRAGLLSCCIAFLLTIFLISMFNFSGSGEDSLCFCGCVPPLQRKVNFLQVGSKTRAQMVLAFNENKTLLPQPLCDRNVMYSSCIDPKAEPIPSAIRPKFLCRTFLRNVSSDQFFVQSEQSKE